LDRAIENASGRKHAPCSAEGNAESLIVLRQTRAEEEEIEGDYLRLQPPDAFDKPRDSAAGQGVRAGFLHCLIIDCENNNGVRSGPLPLNKKAKIRKGCLDAVEDRDIAAQMPQGKAAAPQDS
jgi:hypothetical protein